MADGSKNNLSERSLPVFLSIFITLAVFLTIFAMLDQKGLLFAIAHYFLYGGIIVVVIGFAFLNKGSGRWDGYAQSSYMKNPVLFKKVRVEDRSFEQIVWAVILSGVSIAAIGYFIYRLMAG